MTDVLVELAIIYKKCEKMNGKVRIGDIPEIMSDLNDSFIVLMNSMRDNADVDRELASLIMDVIAKFADAYLSLNDDGETLEDFADKFRDFDSDLQGLMKKAFNNQ